MLKHFVTFYSPGTFVHETTTKEIDGWYVDQALAMSKEIVERHGARPFGFRFSTRMRGENDLDSKEVKHSGTYFIKGKVRTREEILAGTDPNESNLRWNVEVNGYTAVIECKTPYLSTLPLMEADFVLEREE